MDDEFVNLIEDNEVHSPNEHNLLSKDPSNQMINQFEYESTENESNQNLSIPINVQQTKHLQEKNFTNFNLNDNRKELQESSVHNSEIFLNKSSEEIDHNDADRLVIKGNEKGNSNASVPPLLTPEETIPIDPGYENEQQIINESVGDREEGNEGLIKITILEDGHLRLMDASNQSYFFSAEELSRRNIDANALTDENIQEIIQIAMPQLLTNGKITDDPTEPLPKRYKSVDQSNISDIEHSSAFEKMNKFPPPNRPISSSSSDLFYHQQLSSHQQPSHLYSNQQHLDQTQQGRITIISGNSSNDVNSSSNCSRFNTLNNPTTSNTSSSNMSYFPQSTLSVPRVYNQNTGHLYFRNQSNSSNNSVDSRNNVLSDVSIGNLGHVMIGEEMEVRNAEGRIEVATVRYYRQGTGYKIQFADGHFEWLGEASVLELKHHQNNMMPYVKNQQPNSSGHSRFQNQASQQPHFRRISQTNNQVNASQNYSNQHNYQHSSNSVINSHATTSLNSDNLLVNMHQHPNDQRAKFHNRFQHNNHQHNDGVILSHNSSINSNNQSAYRQEVMPPSVLGMRVTVNNDNNLNRSSSNHQAHNQQSQNYQQSNHISDILPSNSYSENNFYCSVCDQHCSQKQLTYIIIRIPACVSCSTKKIAIIDDDHSKNAEHDYVINDKTITENVISGNNLAEKVEFRRSASPDNLSSTSLCQHNETTSNVLDEDLEDENIIRKSNNEIDNLITEEAKTLKFTESMKVKIDASSKTTMKSK